MADSIIVGQFVGSSALAAVGACAALTNVFICVALGAGVGAGVLVSRYFGAREYGKMKTIVSTSLLSFFVLSIVLGVFGFGFSRAMMSGLQTPADILEEAVLYLRVYFAGFPFLFMYNILSTMFTSIGESKIPLGLLIFSSVLILVALGGCFAEHSGVINIALEGMMIIGALFACFTLQGLDQSGFGPAHPQLSMFIAILVAGVTGMIFSLLLGFAAINLKADQTIGGTALNQFAPAFAVVMTWAIQGQGLTTIFIPNWVRITRDTFGLAPVDGPSFWNNLIFKYFYLTTPVAIVLFIAAYIVMYKTRFGLRLRACGEHPQAADSVGINVYKMRYAGVLISGFLGGVGGLAYTLAAGSGFNSDVGGYGFLALAVMIFGNWKPLPILGASLFFALFKVIAALNATLTFLPKFEGVKEISNFYQMLPYIVTMIVLIFTSKNSQAPKAEGIPYDKGSR